MKCLELKFERLKKGFTSEDMMQALGLRKRDQYLRRENGDSKFSPDEIAAATNKLEFSLEKMNDIFFDGKLPVEQWKNAM